MEWNERLDYNDGGYSLLDRYKDEWCRRCKGKGVLKTK